MFRIMMCIIFIVTTPLLAVPVYMEFEGEIIEHRFDPVIGDYIPVGSQFEGRLAYDTEIVSQSQHIPGYSDYVCNAAAELALVVNDYEFISSSIMITVSHNTDPIHDRISIKMLEYSEYEGVHWSISYSFTNTRDNVLDTTNMPTGPLILDDWPSAFMTITDMDVTGMHPPQIRGIVTSITPEPASLLLLAIGGLAVVRRR